MMTYTYTQEIQMNTNCLKSAKESMITFDPGSFPANMIDTSRAGPRAVCPSSFSLGESEEIFSSPTVS